MFIRSLWLAAAGLACTWALGGCGSGSQSPSTNAGAHTRPGGAVSGFPVSVHGAGGVTVLAEAPRRIVSLSPTSTEDLYAIGAGSQVVAVDEKSDYPPNAPRTKLSAYQPNVEAIAAYNPDLVVITDESPSYLAPGLRKLHIPVLLDPAARTLTEAYAQIDELGLATGHAARARALVATMRARIAAIVGSTGSAGRGLSVYEEIESNYYAASSKTFIGQVLSLFGLRNVADKAPDPAGLGYPQLSAEYLVTADPDIVLLTDSACCHQDATTVASRPGWSQMTAVRKHTVVPLDEDIASRWGPRTVVLTEEIAHAVALAHAAGLSG